MDESRQSANQQFERTNSGNIDWLSKLVDLAIENSKRMENDPEYRSQIQKKTR